MKKTIDELLLTPYRIIDILPKRVPKDSPGQYFPIASYLEKNRMQRIKEKQTDLILKLNCYKAISINDEEEINPPVEKIVEAMEKEYVFFRVDEAMILAEAEDTHMTLFNPDEELLDLIKTLAKGEGLFVWKPEEE